MKKRYIKTCYEELGGVEPQRYGVPINFFPGSIS